MKQTFLLLLFACSTAYAQIPDLSGQWNGTSSTPLGIYQVFDEIEQKGLTISGRGKMVNLKKTDSAVYAFEGFIKGDRIEIRQTRYIYKTGIQCLSKIKFSFSRDETGEFLTGKWGTNLVKGGCLPGVSGSIKLMKVKQDPSKIVAENNFKPTTPKIATDDYVGQALKQRLAAGNYYGLFIGIESYDQEGISALDKPIADATALQKVLNDKYQFSTTNSIFIKNATRSEIIESFETLAKIVTSKDQVLIFYAGHGIWDEKVEQGYWLPVDAKLSSRANWLSNSTIRDYLRGIDSKHTLLITDACFSGGILKERAVFQNSRAMLELYKMPSRKALTSGTLTTVPDESVFIKYLVKNLESNQNPMLSSGELFNQFKIAVINNSASGQVPQFGAINQAGDEGGEFIFLKKED